MFNRDYEINEKQVAEYLENAIEKVKTTEDVDTLADLTKLFKKNVPLSLRKYVIAYLLKELLKNNRSFGNGRHNDRNDRNSRFEKKNERRNKDSFKTNNRTEKAAETSNTEKEEERPHHPRVEIPEDKATSIFVSIGKNRRVFPRDLVGILISIAGLDRERIGDIKVLANYSFVQLYTEDAPLAIEKLNGYEYRGRKLAVSYSRQKTEEEDSNEAAEEADMTAEDAAAYAAAEKAAADKEPFGLN
ncbi:MAG: DbpA RNA binding domain-containing protein [Treponema sp.]|nr:DbpA RNA binding domain-containing protein [Treponema sp.]